MSIIREKETIGSRIKKIRIKQNLTQRELCKLTGMTEISLDIYESGEIDPSVRDIARISTALNVTSDYILGRINEKSNGLIMQSRIKSNR